MNTIKGGNKVRERIYLTKCKRCGKPLASLTQSIWGANDARYKYAGICKECMTEEEKQEVQNMVNAAVLRTVEGG